ncbi:TIGR04255 family protein [Mesorhizobium sp. M0293]|uniref:TIGR04255 family protein n=1 Tax=unclassified Mesorhizobium TaxID=325217 RepID=UPI0033375D35
MTKLLKVGLDLLAVHYGMMMSEEVPLDREMKRNPTGWPWNQATAKDMRPNAVLPETSAVASCGGDCGATKGEKITREAFFSSNSEATVLPFKGTRGVCCLNEMRGPGRGMVERDEFFPNSERVIYAKSPLIQVICQIRFPKILRIEASPPADFQDAVRNLYPIVEQQLPPGLQNLPSEVAKMLGAAAQQKSNYQFLSQDRATTIALAPDALSVTSSNYTRWEDFEAPVRLAVEALTNIYKPSFLTRIGLRYQNAVVPADFDIGDVQWAALLSENIRGQLAHSEFSNERITEAFSVVRAMLHDRQEGILLQHGLGQRENGLEKAYVFDIDCYTEKQNDIADTHSYLRRFNARARYAFRWCISDFLHNALGPRPVAEMVGH